MATGFNFYISTFFDIFEKPLRLSPELLGSEACLFLKQAGEVLGVLEAEGVGYLADGVGGRGEAVTGLSDEVLLDELLRTVARLGFHEVAEVVGREVQRVGEVAHGRHSLTCG